MNDRNCKAAELAYTHLRKPKALSPICSLRNRVGWSKPPQFEPVVLTG